MNFSDIIYRLAAAVVIETAGLAFTFISVVFYFKHSGKALLITALIGFVLRLPLLAPALMSALTDSMDIPKRVLYILIPLTAAAYTIFAVDNAVRLIKHKNLRRNKNNEQGE